MTYPCGVGYRLKCASCKSFFYICATCYRGHKFCNAACRSSFQSKLKRERSNRYEEKKESKQLHAARQKRYRKNLQSKKKVTDATSNETPSPINTISSFLSSEPKQNHCVICSKQVGRLLSVEHFFVRRHYESRSGP